MTVSGLAARMYEINAPLRVEEVEFPDPGPDQVLVRVKASGICFSDIHSLRGDLPLASLPIVLGHEGAGIVQACGDGVSGFEVGEPVVIDYVFSCGKCAYCHSNRDNLCKNARLFGFDVNGCFAEYAIVPAKSLVRVQLGLPFEQCAILGCAVSTPYHAFKRAALSRDQTAVLVGIGGVGYHAALLSKTIGARFIAVDISPENLSRAEGIGAELTVNSAETDPVDAVKAFTGKEGVDAAFDFVGTPKTIAQALAMVKKGGVAVLIGISAGRIEIESLDILLREVELRTSIDHTHADLEAVAHLVSEGKLDLSRSITHRVSLKEINDGLRILEQRIDNPIRVAVVQ